jgi:hypothetical protein
VLWSDSRILELERQSNENAYEEQRVEKWNPYKKKSNSTKYPLAVESNRLGKQQSKNAIRFREDQLMNSSYVAFN